MTPDAASSAPSSTASRQPFRPPPVIPNFELLRRIGGGSYGEVWLARNIMGTYRAVKVVYRDRFSDVRPYEREFEGICNFEPLSLSHPSQVSVFHAGRNEEAGYFYYVMELADDLQSGQQIDSDRYEPKTLRSVLNRRGRLPGGECLEIGLPLTAGLKELHGAGLIHRDIKPSNVIFVGGRPKLADIGLVAAAGEECSFVGTEGYVAIEGPGKAQADIYALGKVLYQMFTGLRPDQWPSLPENLGFDSDRNARELNEVINKACEPNVKRRYQSAQEMTADLELLESGRSLVRLRKLERAYRRLLVVFGAAFGAMVLGGLVLGFFVFKGRAADQDLRRELREIQIARTKQPLAGWFEVNWRRLRAAAAIRTDEEVLEQASSMIARFDAQKLSWNVGVAGGFGAFGPDGRAVISGIGTNTAFLMDTGGKLVPLETQGEGPVCWPDKGPPLQLTVLSNSLVLRETISGKVQRSFFQLQQTDTNSTKTPLLALAPDANSIAVGYDGHVSVWSAESGEILSRIPAEASVLAFSPDGSRLGIGETNGTTRVCGVPGLTNQILLRAKSRPSAIRALAFTRDRLISYAQGSRDDSWLVATADQGTEIVIWDLRMQLPRTFCRGSIWMVNALAFHPGGLILASAGQANGRLWDTATGEPLLRFETGATQVRLIAFNRDGTRLVSGDEPPQSGAVIGLWELEPGRGIYPLFGLKAPARKVWFSPNGSRLAALSDDWQVAIWSMDSYGLVHLLGMPGGNTADSAGGAFDASGERFAFASGQEAYLFDLARGVVLQRWRLVDGFTDQLQFGPQGRLLLLRREGCEQPPSCIWRLYELGKSERPILLHQQTDKAWWAYNMAFLANGKQFLVWNGWQHEKQQAFRVFDVASGGEIWRTTNDSGLSAWQVQVDPAQRRFGYIIPRPRAPWLTRVQAVGEIGRDEPRCDAIGLAGERLLGGYWLSSSRPDEPKLPLVTDWTHESYVSAFSPDGERLAWGTEEGVVLVADIPEVRRHLAALRR